MTVSQQDRERFLKALGAEAAAFPAHIERDFPHVFENIVQLWGAPETLPFLNDLLVTQRAGRKGFPPEAVDEILGLIRACHRLGLVPEPVPRPGDVWEWANNIGFEKERHER